MKFDLVVIGSGMSGVMAALRGASQGKKVAVVRKAWGTTALSSGAFDIIETPGEYEKNPFHPYHQLDFENLPIAVELFKKWFPLKIQGSYHENHLFLVQTGKLKKAAFALDSQFADLRALGRKKILALGISSLISPPQVVWEDMTVGSISWPHREDNLSPFTLAKKLDHPEEIKKFAQHVKSKFQLNQYDVLLMPPILGFNFFSDMKKEFELHVGIPVYEMLGCENSVPGIRLQKALDATLRKAGVQLIESRVKSFEAKQKKIISIEVEKEILEADHFVLATGKFISGGIEKHKAFKETVFDLPLFYQNEKINEWGSEMLIKDKFLKKQPLFTCGVKVDKSLTPINEFNEPVFTNLRACGTILSGFDPYREGTRFGVQVLSGYKAGDLTT